MSTSVNIKSSLLEQVKARAAKEGRSVSSMICVLLTSALINLNTTEVKK